LLRNDEDEPGRSTLLNEAKKTRTGNIPGRSRSLAAPGVVERSEVENDRAEEMHEEAGLAWHNGAAPTASQDFRPGPTSWTLVTMGSHLACTPETQ